MYALRSTPEVASRWRRVDELHEVTQLDWTRVQAALWHRHLPVASLTSFKRLTYLPEPFVNRAALARAKEEGWPPQRTNRTVCHDTRQVVQPALGEVLWLRGNAFPGAVTPAAVHRSPPHDSGSMRRLLLSVDALATVP